MTAQREFRVDISRPLKPVRVINGLEVFEDSGLNYVDCFFPDGSQRTWGYIGRAPIKGSQFAPLAGCKQGLADAIQAEINKMLDCQADESAPAPVMIEDTTADIEESEDEDE
jgi:hypothetical protein